jgi:branched-subunit amino acid aminotransferase/4-amino-4-deoxychorismate lyase
MREITQGRLVEGGAAGEPAGSQGIFETVLLAQGRPVFFAEHLGRFAAGCAHFGLRQAPGAEALRTAAEDLVRRAGLSYGVLRWAAWVTPGGEESWSLRLEPPRPAMLKSAWIAAVSERRLPPQGMESLCKHLGRTIWREALAAGRAAGCDEVVLADAAGRVVEGAITNIFCREGDRWLTPSLACHPLPGIARAKLLDLARELGDPVEETELTLARLRAAEEVFVTNSLISLRPVAALDRRILPAPGSGTRRLQAAWSEKFGWVPPS